MTKKYIRLLYKGGQAYKKGGEVKGFIYTQKGVLKHPNRI